MPDFGSMFIELEKVPTINNGKLAPAPNAKRSAKPRTQFLIAATTVKSKTRPGDKHGDAIVPMAVPRMNAAINDPPLVFPCLGFRNEGVYISYSPNIEKARYSRKATRIIMKAGLAMILPSLFPPRAAKSPKSANVLARPSV